MIGLYISRYIINKVCVYLNSNPNYPSLRAVRISQNFS